MDKKTEVNQRATKKNRKRAVQKWIMAIVAASMVASMVAGVVAPAVSAKSRAPGACTDRNSKKERHTSRHMVWKDFRNVSCAEPKGRRHILYRL